jgi:hypothetical protein
MPAETKPQKTVASSATKALSLNVFAINPSRVRLNFLSQLESDPYLQARGMLAVISHKKIVASLATKGYQYFTA